MVKKLEFGLNKMEEENFISLIEDLKHLHKALKKLKENKGLLIHLSSLQLVLSENKYQIIYRDTKKPISLFMKEYLESRVRSILMLYLKPNIMWDLIHRIIRDQMSKEEITYLKIQNFFSKYSKLEIKEKDVCNSLKRNFNLEISQNDPRIANILTGLGYKKDLLLGAWIKVL